MNKKDLESAKDWIISNQNSDGAIFWDEKGKCDAWDHSECLIALAIFEEWEVFDKGVDWILNNINSDGHIYSEFNFNKPSRDFFEAHHAAYIFLPLLQRYLIDGKKEYLKKISNELKNIYVGMKSFKDDDGYFYWAKSSKGYSDNSLITATCSVELSRRAYKYISEVIGDSFSDNDDFLNKEMLTSRKFNRDGIDRSRFSMDCYYPLLCGYRSESDVTKLLKDFYVEGLGIKCVIEEPWVTLAESSEAVIALIKSGEKEAAHKIFSDIIKFKNKDGIFPTGYQYKLDILWPEENSTWTNAAVIMAADCLFDLTGKDKAILI